MADRLPGAENANPILSSLIEEMDAGTEDMTADYLSGNFLDLGHPAVRWLKECFNVSARHYARNAGIDYEMDWHIQAWPNVNRFGIITTCTTIPIPG